eukprot:m.30034 g.30034  ORF g.30034 m.30034 type:complete len:1564 (-) comp9211_c1_seq1:365-5056(-)
MAARRSAILFAAFVLAVAWAQDPEIRTTNGTIEFLVPVNTSINVVYQNPDGTESSPVPLTTKTEMDALRAQQQQMQNILDTLLATTANNTLAIAVNRAAIATNAGDIATNAANNNATFSALLAKCPEHSSRHDGSSPCICRAGYTGTIVQNGASFTGSCTAAPCPPSTVGTAPACFCANGLVGAVVAIPGGYTSNCYDPFSPLYANLSSSIDAVSSAARSDAVAAFNNITSLGAQVLQACPANSRRADAVSPCVCSHGYSGTITQTGNIFSGTCTLNPCPPGSTGTAPSCVCLPGMIGSVVAVAGGYISNCADALSPLYSNLTSQSLQINASLSGLSSTVSQLSSTSQQLTTATATSASTLNRSVFCNDRGLLFSATSNTCSMALRPSQPCSTLPLSVTNGVLSGPTCVAGAPSGSVCTPMCNPGLTLTGFYVCVDGVWGGAPACTNQAPLWVTPAGLLGILVFGNPLLSSTSTLATGASLVATDPENAALQYTLTSGVLPPGISLTSSGSLLGQLSANFGPANNCQPAVTNFTFTALVTDGVTSTSRTFSILVSAAAVVRQLAITASSTWTVPSNSSSFIDVLLVGGGGGGGTRHAGGGGAGGVVFQQFVPVTPGQYYVVTIGAGGAGAPAQAVVAGISGSPGGVTSFTLPSLVGFSAFGGGAGGGGAPGGAGGSGGGGAGGNAGGSGTPGQGNSGSQGCGGASENFYSGGGGGGAGGPAPASSCGNSAAGGNGGPGVTYFGFNLAAGGGGGSSPSSAGFVGQGGFAGGIELGGDGSAGLAAGLPGTPNTGSGGGGGGVNLGASGAGGAGGSGFVLVRWCEVVTTFNSPPVWTSPASGSLGTVTTANLNINALPVTRFVAADPENFTLVYSVTSGTLPPGLTLSSSGQLSGTFLPEITPSNSCASLTRNYSFTVSAQDGVHSTGRVFWIVVTAAGTFRTASFSTAGAFNWTGPGSVPLTADVLVVGGGGSGGTRHGGGGGGGGVVVRTGVSFTPNMLVTGQVGAGGPFTGSSTTASPGVSGGPSFVTGLITITALGGGGGAGAGLAAGAGGSGGGGTAGIFGGLGSLGQGFHGSPGCGNGGPATFCGGGGGGANGAGTMPVCAAACTPGNGGAGITVWGSTYGAGGGGGSYTLSASPAASGGFGGGGAGSQGQAVAGSGTCAGCGGGGAGFGDLGNGAAGVGMAGIVVFRWCDLIGSTPAWTTLAGLIGSLTATSPLPSSLPALVATEPNNLPLTYTITGGNMVPGVVLFPNGTWGGTPTVTLPGQPTPVTSCVDPSAATYTFTATVSNGFVWVTRQFTISLGIPVALGSVRIITPGSSSWTVPAQIFPSIVEVLVVGGGGGGGSRHGGGGGGGGVVYNTSYAVTPGASIPYTVAGQSGVAAAASAGPAGGNSVFGVLTAFGGAGGGSALVGGSGAGGTGSGASSLGRTGQGNGGGTGCSGGGIEAGWCGGGGGGAGSAGTSATCVASPVTCSAGAGGAGFNFWGFNYGAGGGGGASTTSTSAGAGGATTGGAGSMSSTAAAGSPAAGTGSGGGGGGFAVSTNSPAGAGASGAVVVRWCVRV